MGGVPVSVAEPVFKETVPVVTSPGEVLAEAGRDDDGLFTRGPDVGERQLELPLWGTVIT